MRGASALRVHPVAALFPLLSKAELEALAADIKANGLQQPAVVQGDVLLDGRNRLIACKLAGVRPEFSEYEGDSPVAFIIGANVHRRHLSPSEKAAVGVDIEPFFAEEARKRQATSTGGAKPQLVANLPQAGSKARDQVAALLGISGRQVSDAKFVKQVDPDAFERIKAGGISVHAAKREVRRRLDAKSIPNVAMPSGKYRTIVIDPPWDWGDEGDVSQMGRAVPEYATMPITDIESLPIKDLADENCHLYLWITNRSLPKGFRLLEAWGFRYIQPLTWCKPSIGIGNYFRNNTEHILFAVKGSQRLLRFDVGTWFSAERGKGHSTKPDAAYELIASCSPAPRLDMFARQDRDGFSRWGNNAESV